MPGCGVPDCAKKTKTLSEVETSRWSWVSQSITDASGVTKRPAGEPNKIREYVEEHRRVGNYSVG